MMKRIIFAILMGMSLTYTVNAAAVKDEVREGQPKSMARRMASGPRSGSSGPMLAPLAGTRCRIRQGSFAL